MCLSLIHIQMCIRDSPCLREPWFSPPILILGGNHFLTLSPSYCPFNDPCPVSSSRFSYPSPQKKKKTIKRSQRDLPEVSRLCSFVFLLLPVSYTHLDVYKRQVMVCCCWLLIVVDVDVVHCRVRAMPHSLVDVLGVSFGVESVLFRRCCGEVPPCQLLCCLLYTSRCV